MDNADNMDNKKFDNNLGSKENSTIIVYAGTEFLSLFPHYRDYVEQTLLHKASGGSKAVWEQCCVLFICTPAAHGSQEQKYVDLEELLGNFYKKNDVLKQKSAPHALMIIVEKFSSVNIYDTLITSGVIEKAVCFVQEGANVTFLCDNRVRKGAKAKATNFDFYLETSSHLHVTLFGKGSSNIKQVVHLQGEYARAMIHGFFVLRKNSATVLFTEQKHMASNTQSSAIIHSLLADDAKLAYDAKIRVEKDCSGVRVTQRNKNIVLGDTVTVQAKPQMEILHNQVACTHGCAIGNIDKEKLFYLQTRGLSKKQAKQIIITELFDFLIRSVDTKSMKDELVKRINNTVRQIL